MSAVTLAVVQKSSALAVIDPHATAPVPRLVLPQGRWPAWRPGANQLAISTIELTEPASSSVYLTDLDHASPVQLYRSPEGVVPVIAPRLPHYLLWSPSGERLAIVGQGEFGLQLEIAVPSKPGSREVLETGAPIFSTWHPGGSSIASHIGTSLNLFRLDETPVSRVVVEEKAAGFRVPVFTSDGTALVYATAAEPGVAVFAYSLELGENRELARFAGGVAFSALPEGRISVAVTRQPESGVFDGLWTFHHSAPGDRELVTHGPFVAAFWSPSGDRVVLVIPSQVGDGRYSLQVRNPEGQLVAASDAFIPSVDLRTMLGFWDQYALSHHLWSPDGSDFAIAGRLPTDGVSGSFGDPIGGYVYLWHPARKEPLRLLTPGELAFFPPA